MDTALRNDTGWVAGTPILDDLQAGSLRRILNLSAQLPDDWSGMMGPTTLQEDFGALRFQLAFMSYALALTHVHRMPAAPALFKNPFDNLIQKILSPDCWIYWHYVSTGNGPFNKSLGELPAQWDPVASDNIMYSAYVQSMALLYHYVFRDQKYAQEGALTFAINPLFWGAGGKSFAYDERSLNQHLYWSMVERGYLGIACEPNCVFQVCNQPSILGFRLHDMIYGGDTASEVTQGYLKAWDEFGGITKDGHFTVMVQERERVMINPPGAPWTDFWLGSLMHAWNPDVVERNYPQQIARWSVEGPEGTLWVKPAPSPPTAKRPHTSARDFGWAAACAAEVGDTQSLDRLLAYADKFLHPKWSEGAYFYPRNDQGFDENGLLTAMDPHTANALLPLARLNIPGGFKRLYDGSLDDAHFTQPAVVKMTEGVDLRRAWFEPEHNALALTLGAPAAARKITLEIANAPGAPRVSCVDGVEPAAQLHHQGDRVVLDLEHKGPATLVLAW